MNAMELVTQQDAEKYIKSADPSAYAECSGNIYGTHKGLPILLAGHWDWLQAIENIYVKEPRRTAFGYYVLETK